MPGPFTTNTNIIGVKYKNKWILLGNTYNHKESLKPLGVSYDPDGEFGKYWYYNGPILPESLKKYVQYTIDTSGQPKPEAIQIVQEVQEQPELYTQKIRETWRKRTHRNHAKFHELFTLPEIKKPNGFIAPSWFEDLLFYLQYPNVYPVIAIVGPTGNGKTTAASIGYESLERQFKVIDITESIEPYELAGGMTYDPIKGNIWIDGMVTSSFRNGQDILINEFDAANPRAALCLQSALQTPGVNGSSRYITTPQAPDHDRIYPQGPCQIIVTMNTFGSGATRMYTGRNGMDQATLDRFAFIDSGYENEALMLISKGYSKKMAEQLEKWAVKTRAKIDQHGIRANVSPRTLERMAHYMTYRNIPMQEAARIQFLSRIDPDDRELLA